jgi:hypothetical protein
LLFVLKRIFSSILNKNIFKNKINVNKYLINNLVLTMREIERSSFIFET